MTGIEWLAVGWVASPVIIRVFDKAEKYLVGNYKLHKKTRKMIETLSRTLLLCRATVEAAERRMVNNPDLASWLKLKEAAYDAEDVLDDMEAQSFRERVHEKNKVSEIASPSVSRLKNTFKPDDNLKRLKEVLAELEKISNEIQTFAELVKLNENDTSNKHEPGGSRKTSSQPEYVKLYGREEELNLILDLVLDPESGSSEKKGQNNPDLLIIPIVGMGGVGKTALAQAVYNHSEVQHSYAYKSWISVSCNLDVVMLMRILIQTISLPVSSNAVVTLQYVTQELSSIISGKRFLVVLDDVFQKIENRWDHLYNTLSRGAAPGSVVLITTQNQAFANRVGTISPIPLEPLELGEFWELFKSFAFGDSVILGEKRVRLEQIGKQIASNLRGLPLAAKIIGKLLRRYIDEDKWRIISESEWWNIDIEVKTQILPSIAVSYQRLDPPCLRQCFAYCSLFPKNSLIDKERLVQMWIGQNFISHDDTNGSKRLEEIGREWFDKLVEMCFFQHAGDYNGYVMPNLMHDLAVIVSSAECFYLTDQSHQIPQGIRHLAVDTKDLELLKKIGEQKHIRSFLYFGLPHIDGMFSTINQTLSNLKSIRILDLSYLHMMERKQPPKAIQKLTHLRFLDLSFTGIERLSHSFLDNHYHLQSFHIQQFKIHGVQWKRGNISLPTSIKRLVNIRHLNADAETIARITGLGQLVNLQELDGYRVGKEKGHKITELKNMRELTGHLRIINCEAIESKEEAAQAKLIDKKYLHSVELCWGDDREEFNTDEEILEGLKPHRGIKELKIERYMGSSFPDWMTDVNHFTNLQTIRLVSCRKMEVLPPLGQLPSLSTLEVDGFGALRDAPLHCFPTSLKALNIADCDNLSLLAESLHHLTLLTRLQVCVCPIITSLNLSGLTSLEELRVLCCRELSIGGDLQSLTNLKSLEIRGCPELFRNSMNDIMSAEQKGKGLQVHQAEGLPSLSYLEVDYESLLHSDFHLILGRLPSLRFFRCEDLQHKQFTEDQTLWFQELTALQELVFYECAFRVLPCSLAMLSSLRKLELFFCKDFESLPANGMPPSLRELTLSGCSELRELPSSLSMLSSLKKLELSSCRYLESLPASGMPPSLWELSLSGCSQNLVQRCQPNRGEDWHLISHVPIIRIDGTIINRPQTSAGTSAGYISEVLAD